MAKSSNHTHLSRRERQIMDVLYAASEATAHEVHAGIPDAPSYSAVRALLKKLLDKGHVVYRVDGTRYVYRPVMDRGEARQGAVQRLLETFFDGSPAEAVMNLLGQGNRKLSADDLDEIEAMIADMRRQDASAAARSPQPSAAVSRWYRL